MARLSNLDLLIIGVYLLGVWWIGIKQVRQQDSLNGFFLADRGQKWPTVGLSLFASSISSSTLIGLCGAAYLTGISISAYEWVGTLVLIFISIYFIPYFLATKVTTMPEFLEKRFDGRLRYYFSFFTIIGNIFIENASVLFAGSLIIMQFIPQLNLLEASTILALMAGVYTAAGGLRAVMYTNVLQAIVLLIGSSCLTYLAYQRIGSWEQIVQLTPPEMLSLFRPADDPTMPWTGLLIGVPILGLYHWCSNQSLAQNFLAAKNIHHARLGALLAGLLKLSVLFLMVFPGIMARFIYPNIKMGDEVFPQLLATILPYGLKGLVLAGFMAALMSTMASTLHSTSTLITMDFLQKLRPQTHANKLIRIGRIITLMLMILSFSWVPVIASFSGLFSYLQILSYLVPPIVAIFLLGLFWNRTTSSGAFWGLLLGHLFALSIFILHKLTPTLLPDLHFLLWAGIFALMTTVTVMMISFCTPPSQHAQIKGLVWNRQLISDFIAGQGPNPWWQDYRYYSVLLVFLTTWIIIAFP